MKMIILLSMFVFAAILFLNFIQILFIENFLIDHFYYLILVSQHKIRKLRFFL